MWLSLSKTLILTILHRAAYIKKMIFHIERLADKVRMSIDINVIECQLCSRQLHKPLQKRRGTKQWVTAINKKQTQDQSHLTDEEI